MKIIYIVNYLILINLSKYHYFINKTQAFRENKITWGGKINSFFDISNGFMVTFWFKFNDIENNFFPFITLFKGDKIYLELVLKKKKFLVSNYLKTKIPIVMNKIYFFQLKFYINDSWDRNLIINIKDNELIEMKNDINLSSNDYYFIINRLNWIEDLIVEKLIFYDEIIESDLLYKNSKILYFINFSNNYPNSKWIQNEIKNEFGPSLNGDNINNYNNIFLGNILDEKVQWETISDSEINFTPLLAKYLIDFKWNKDFFIFSKFNFTFLAKPRFTDTYTINILSIYNINFKMSIEKSGSDFNFNFYINNESNNIQWKKPNSSAIQNLNIDFLTINIRQTLNSNFNIKYNLNVNQNTNIYSSLITIAELTGESIKILTNGYNHYMFIWKLILHEFILGIGSIEYSNSKIENQELINPFILYSNEHKNLKRINGFNEDIDYKKCGINNCIICRNNLNKCEFCNINYYLENEICAKKGTDDKLFINNYSELITSEIDSYVIGVGGIITDTGLKIEDVINNQIVHIQITKLTNFDLIQKTLNNVYNNYISINNKILNFSNKLDNDLMKSITHNNTTYTLWFSIRSINCDEEIYNNFNCNDICGSNNYLFFNNIKLLKGNCKSGNISHYYKLDTDNFKYYYNCPDNCNNCSINNNNWICNQCNSDFNLINNECIQKILLNCNSDNIGTSWINNISKLNLYTCQNNCNNKGLNKIYLINYFKNMGDCNISNNTNIILFCNNDNTYYNHYSKECIKCPEGDYNSYKSYLIENCDEYKNINLEKDVVCEQCIDNYHLTLSNKCYKNIIENCIKYVSDGICKECIEGYYIVNDNKCHKHSIDNCNKYSSDNSKCIECNNGYYLIINDNKCHKHSVNNCNKYLNNSNGCIECKIGYFLIKNINNICHKYNVENCYKYLINTNYCLECQINYLKIKEDNKCILCDISISSIKEYKIYDKSINYDINQFSNLNFFNKIKNISYFIIIDLPNLDKIYINWLNINKNITFLSKNNNKSWIYTFDFDFNNNKLLLVPNINTYLNKLNLDLVIKEDIFINCKFKTKIYPITIKIKNKEFKNDSKLKLESEFPILNVESKEYKQIEKYTSITKSTSKAIFDGSYILSILSPSILSFWSLILPTLLFFNFITLVNINFGSTLNTLLNLLKFNDDVYEIDKYIFIDKKIIEYKLYDRYNSLLKLQSWNYIPFYKILQNYFFIILILSIYLFIIFIEIIYYIWMLIYNFYLKKRRIHDLNKLKPSDLKITKEIKKKNMQRIKNIRFRLKNKNVKRLKIFLKILKKMYAYFKKILIIYLFGFIESEIANIIFLILIYITTINLYFNNTTAIFINLFLFFNYILVIYQFYINLKVINMVKNNSIKYTNNRFFKLIKDYFIPYENKNNLILYFKIADNFRFIAIFIFLIYFNFFKSFQLIMMILIQLVFFVYIILICEKKLVLILLVIKEFLILIFMIFLPIINYSAINNFTTIVLIIIIMIISIAIIEFLILSITNLISSLKYIHKYIKNKKYKELFK